MDITSYLLGKKTAGGGGETGGITPTKNTQTRLNNEVKAYFDWLENNPYLPMTPKTGGADYVAGEVPSYFDNNIVTARNDKPVGVALNLNAGHLSVTDDYSNLSKDETVSGGSKKIYNIIKGSYTNVDSNNDIKNCGIIAQTGSLRMINTATTDVIDDNTAGNVRDIGGWACDGGTIKYGKIFRGREISSNDIPILVNQLGVRRELNLRESETSNTVSVLGNQVKFYRPPMINYYSVINPYLVEILNFVFEGAKYNEPTYIHCLAGADRTGTILLIIEAILGMAQTDIDKDYEMTYFYYGTGIEGNNRKRNAPMYVSYINQINKLSGSTFRDKILNYLGSLGFTAVKINEFRHNMIDGNPTDIELETDNITITNTLSHCSNSNSATTGKKDTSYTATITADTDYTIHNEDVSITMGGTDITTTAYNNGVITIPEITGNIVITITATKPVVYTNQVPISIDSSGNIYNNGLGYKDGYRLNSSGVEAVQTADGAIITGFIPVKSGDVIRFAGEYISGDIGGENTWFYKSDFTLASTTTNATPVKFRYGNGGIEVYEPYVWDATNKRALSFTVPTDSNIAYMRCTLHGTTGANAIITVNEQID